MYIWPIGPCMSASLWIILERKTNPKTNVGNKINLAQQHNTQMVSRVCVLKQDPVRCVLPGCSATCGCAYLHKQHNEFRNSIEQQGIAEHSTEEHSTKQRSIAQRNTTMHSTTEHSTKQHSIEQHGKQHSIALNRSKQHSIALAGTNQYTTVHQSTKNNN